MNQGKIEYIDLMDRLSQFTEREKEWILRNAGVIQLTYGCGSACSPFCQAPRDVRGAFTFGSLEKAIEEYGDLLNYGLREFDVTLYWHSEPLDYRHDGKTIADVVRLFKERINFVPSVSTSLPEYGFDIALQLFDDGILDKRNPNKNRLGRGKISVPYYFRKEPYCRHEKIYSTISRTNKFIEHLAKARGLETRDAKDRLPIHEIWHRNLTTVSPDDFVLISPINGESTGIYFHQGGAPPLSYLENEINPANIGNYMRHEINPIAIRNRISAPLT